MYRLVVVLQKVLVSWWCYYAIMNKKEAIKPVHSCRYVASTGSCFVGGFMCVTWVANISSLCSISTFIYIYLHQKYKIQKYKA